MAGIASFSDSFPSSLDTTSKWNIDAAGGGTVAVVSGEAELQHTWDTDFTGWPPPHTGIRTKTGYDIVGSSLYWRFKPIQVSDGGVGNDGSVTTVMGAITSAANGNAGAGFVHNSADVSNGSLYCKVFNNATDEWWADVAQIASYNPNGNHAWLRVRESGGTYFWDTAPDNGSGSPGTWTNQASYSSTGTNVDATSQSTFRTAGNALATFYTYHWSNAFQASYVTSKPRVDGINSPVSATTTHATSGAIAGPGAVVTGTAKRFRAHATSGAIAGPGAVVTGSAARTGAPPNHVVNGAIAGPGAVVTGSAKITKKHATTGAIVGPGAVLAGTTNHGTKLSSVKDDFAGAFDTSKWAATVTSGTGTAADSGGQLVLNPTSANSGDGIEVRSVLSESLIGDAVFCRLSQAPRTAANDQGVEARFAVEASAGNSLGWFPQSDGSIQAQRRVAGVVEDNAIFSYTPSTHAWLRLKEAAGQFYMQTAPSSAQDPPLEGEWVTRYQIATADIGFSLTNVKMVLGCVVWWNQAGVPTQPAKFDCVNTKTIAPLTHNATGAIAGPGAVLAGAAAKKVLHVTSGAIPGQAAVVAGAAKREKAHHCTGAIYGAGAIISANGSTSDITRKRWFDKQDTAGAWSETPQTADPWTPKDVANGGWGSK